MAAGRSSLVSSSDAGDIREARLHQILAAMMSFRDGDVSARLPVAWDGIEGRIADAFNQTISHEETISREVRELSISVGKEGRLKQRLKMSTTGGSWAIRVDSINTLIDDLVRPTTEVARAIGAVAKGDLSQSMELEVDGRPLQGEFLRSAKLVNKMIDQLSVFTSEVTRVAREVGTEGKLLTVPHKSRCWRHSVATVRSVLAKITEAECHRIANNVGDSTRMARTKTQRTQKTKRKQKH